MKRNFAYTAVSVGSRLLVGLLLFLLLARLWGPAQFGLFSFVFSVCALLALMVDFGFSLYLMREVAAKPDDAAALVSEAFRTKLMLTAVAVAVAGLIAWIIGPRALPPGLMAPLLLAALAMSFSDFFVAPLRALGRFDLETRVVTSANAMQFALAGTVAWHGGSPMLVAWAMAAARCVYLLLARRAVSKVVPGLRLNWKVTSGGAMTLRRAWPYGADSMLATVWTQLDVVVVRTLFGVQSAGLYSAGQKVVVGVCALAPVVGNVMIPRLTQLAMNASPSFMPAAAKTSGLMGAIGIVFAMPMLMTPDTVAQGLFGQQYAGLSVLLPFFGLLLLLRYISASAGVVATAVGMQLMRVVSQLVGLTFAALVTSIFVLRGLTLEGFVAIIALATMVVFMSNVLSLWRFHLRRIHR